MGANLEVDLAEQLDEAAFAELAEAAAKGASTAGAPKVIDFFAAAWGAGQG